VLVLDDNPDMVTGLTMLLQASGLRVTAAQEGAAALQAARAERPRPDVILMDIGLPRMDGYQIAEQLRKEVGYDFRGLSAI
jgi:CheY-like chemotaxis protein